VLISCAEREIASGRRWGKGRLADCQISSRTNAVRSINPLISTSCTPKYTTFCIPKWDVASKACQMLAIRYDQRPLGSHACQTECPATVRTTSVIELYNTSGPVGLQELAGG